MDDKRLTTCHRRRNECLATLNRRIAKSFERVVAARKALDDPAGWSRRGLLLSTDQEPVSYYSDGLLAVSRLRELLHPRRLALLHFLVREIFFARRDRPPVAVRVGEGPGAIAPELIRHLPHGPGLNLRARRNGAVEERVAILHVDPERSG